MPAYPTTDILMAEFWNELGQFWVDEQERMDKRLRPYGQALIAAAAPAPGERGLDIGCGCGDTTFTMAQRLGPDGAAMGLDVSKPMIAHARRRAAGAHSDLHVTFEDGDAGRVTLPEAHFDLAISRFGVMFFEQPARALAHLQKSLKPGGRLVFICWRKLDENPWMKHLTGAVAPFAPPAAPPSPEAPGPFSFGDPDRVRRILTEAGFTEPTFDRFDCPMDMGPNVETALAEYVHRGSTAALLSELDDQTRSRAIEAVRSVLSAHLTRDGVRMDSAAWIVRTSRA